MKPVLALMAAVILTGCEKHEDSAASAPPPAGTADGSGAADANLAGTLSDLTQTLRKFSAENRRIPKDINELTSAGYLTALPPAPAGKKFAIDEKKVQVVLLNQ